MPRRGKQNKELQVIEEYFASGLADAIRDSLKSLFSEPLLPDNPYYYLASALGAYVDQNDLWAETDVAVLSAMDNEGGLEVVDANSKLCKLAAGRGVLGMPHVLRCVSKEGARIVRDVLTNSLPDTFFPGPTPFSSSKDGYTLQILSTVQGSTVIWHPQWLEFPELTVRCDVVVRGPRLDDALELLAQLLTSDLQELEAVPVYFVEGLRLVEPLATRHLRGSSSAVTKSLGSVTSGPPGGTVGPSGLGLWRMSDVLSRPDDFRKVLSREILSGKQVVMAGVIMLEAPIDAAHLQVYKARFESYIKTYCFHFKETPDPSAPAPAPLPITKISSKKSSNKEAVMHYGSQPYEALFEGFFLEPAAAKAYIALFQGNKSGPYGKTVLQANSDQLANLIEADMIKGDSLEGFRRLLLLAFLQDSNLLQKGPLNPSMVLSLEELLLMQVQDSQPKMLLSTTVNLVRMLNSGAADIQGIVRELDALMLIVEQWPRRKQACIARATAAAAVVAAASVIPADTGGKTSPPSAAAATGMDEGHAEATLAWLSDYNNMEARVVKQLTSLKPRVVQETGSGIFSGVSIILSRLLSKLPDDAPGSAEACQATLEAAQEAMGALRQLMAAAALSLADALLDRCRDVMWALQRFGIRLVDSVMARAALVRDEADLPPEWVLDVNAVTDTQVRSGAVAERVATEGVMLQYAVDTKLDVCLSNMFEAVTTPPLPVNPYPQLLQMLRAYAARLDLWQDDVPTVSKQLVNQLVLLTPPVFIYAASPPAASSRDNQRHMRAGAALMRSEVAAGADDEEDVTVYGSYAAVTLCDCRSLQSLTGSLGHLLSQRHWQQGSYCADILPALTGDAAFSGSFSLGKPHELMPAAAGNRQWGQGSNVPSPYEHPRFYRIDIEEHHQVEGPLQRTAATLFATGVVDYVVDLHHNSQHIVQHVAVGPDTFKLPALLQPSGQQAMVAALVSAVDASIVRHRATSADVCLAVVHLLAVVKEGLYVRVLKNLHFSFKNQELPHSTGSTAALAAHRHLAAPPPLLPDGGYSIDPDPAGGSALTALAAAAAGTGRDQPDLQVTELEAIEPHWDIGVYQRVFLSESAAKAWHSWNNFRGDPAQPFHHQHLLQQVEGQVRELEAQGCLLDAQKLLVTAAAVRQDAGMMCNVSRALQSAAQELRCLQDVNAALQLLLAEDLPQEHRVKLDGERVRRLFLVYCSRMRRAMTSPKYCYFSGFAAVAPRLLADLREHVLNSFKLDAKCRANMEQLNMWTLACELSVAASIHDCFDGDVKHHLL